MSAWGQHSYGAFQNGAAASQLQVSAGAPKAGSGTGPAPEPSLGWAPGQSWPQNLVWARRASRAGSEAGQQGRVWG